MNPKIFKAYDIRGIYPNDINEDNIIYITKAIYTFLTRTLNKHSLTIVLGRDMRLSSPSLMAQAKIVLINLGAQVIDVGLVSTPTLYFAVKHLECDAGIQISASHNPKEYNGIKYLYKKAYGQLVKVAKNTGMDQVKEYALSQDFTQDISGGSSIEKDVSEEEIDYAISTVSPSQIKTFKVVADPANAMGIIFLEKLFARYPQIKLVKMNFQLDGSFPSHEANPLKFELLKPLQEKIISEKADFGIATDGDADRVFFLDENGEVIPATMITSLIAREILRKKKGEKILVDVRYVRNAQKVIEDEGGKMEMNVVGHSLITEHLNRVRGAFAGESSGHFFFRETGGAESTVRVILYMLNILSRENKPLSEIVKTVHSSFESGETNYALPPGLSAKKVFDDFASKYKDANIILIDGVTIEYPDWRFNLRASNTEPLIRLNLEAKSEDLMKIKLQEVKDIIFSYPGVTAS